MNSHIEVDGLRDEIIEVFWRRSDARVEVLLVMLRCCIIGTLSVVVWWRVRGHQQLCLSGSGGFLLLLQ